MKCLFVTPYYPYPLNTGGKVCLYNLLKNITRYHDITLLSIFDPKEDVYAPTLENYCKKVVVVEKTPSNFKRDFLMSLLPFSMSYVIKSRYESAMHEKLEELVRIEKFDVIFYEFLHSIMYIRNSISIPQIFNVVDISFLKAKREFKVNTWRQPLLKYINYIEFLKVRKLETTAWNKVNAVIAFTEHDKEYIKHINPKLEVEFIPRGVDAEFYKPDRNEKNIRDEILFLGARQNTLNTEAIRFFLKSIWPIILSKKPSTVFKIIGSGYGNIFKKEKNVIEVGYVPDMRCYFNSSKVFIAPLLNGSGLRFKLLEAMAMGCPIVSTSIGCEGLDLVDEKEIFIRNDKESFAEAVVKLMNDSKLREELSVNSRKKVLENYHWESIIDKFNTFTESIAKETG